MDINLLTLSLGNSRLAIGQFIGGELRTVTRLLHTQQADWAGVISSAWEKVNADGDGAVAGASVNPKLLEQLEHAVQQSINQTVHWVGRDIDLPIAVQTEAPGETGVDRVLNIAAAHEQLGHGCAVVDAGTAITIDVCDDAGNFLGGAIAPGLAMQLDALHERTAKLPGVQFHEPTGLIGKGTHAAILHGVFHGIRGLVKEVVENYASELGRWPELIATGGDAAALFTGWEVVHAVSPDLTTYGIALAYANHYIKHG